MRAIAEVELAAPFDLGELLVANGVEFVLAHASELDHLFIAHDDGLGTIDDRAHGELGLKGHADLAHQDQIERRVECGRDLGRNRHAAARQGQHDRPLILVTRERLGELSAGIGAIDEWHHGLRELPGIAAHMRAEMRLEPSRGMLNHDIERAGLREQMGRAGHDLDRLRRASGAQRPAR